MDSVTIRKQRPLIIIMTLSVAYNFSVGFRRYRVQFAHSYALLRQSLKIVSKNANDCFPMNECRKSIPDLHQYYQWCALNFSAFQIIKEILKIQMKKIANLIDSRIKTKIKFLGLQGRLSVENAWSSDRLSTLSSFNYHLKENNKLT